MKAFFPDFATKRLKWKISLVVLLILLLGSWVMGFVAKSVVSSIHLEKRFNGVSAELKRTESVITEPIKYLHEETQLLAQSTVINNLIVANDRHAESTPITCELNIDPYRHPEQVPLQCSKKNIKNWLIKFLDNKAYFLGIRYLRRHDDDTFATLVAVEKPGAYDSSSIIYSSPTIISDLSDGDRPTYLSKVYVQSSHIAIITAIAPVFYPPQHSRAGRLFGVIAIDMNISIPLQKLLSTQSNISGNRYITDGKGDFLIKPPFMERNITQSCPSTAPVIQNPRQYGIFTIDNNGFYGHYYPTIYYHSKNNTHFIGTGWITKQNILQNEIDNDPRSSAIYQTALLLSAVMGFLIMLLLHYFLRPLSHIIKATRYFAQRRYDKHLDPAILNRTDEIGELANAFEAMVAKIRFDEDRSLKINRNLEHLVSKRTAALELQHHHLRRKNQQLAIATKQAQEARDKAQEANMAKDHFFAKMGHELRTPLQVITLAAEALEKQTKNQSDTLYLDAQDALVSGWTLAEQIDCMMMYAQNNAGRMSPEYLQLDIRALVAELEGPIRRIAQYNENVFTISIADNIQFMWTDKLWIKNALINLLNNACKFTEGGSVDLTIRYSADLHDIFFQVSDCGIGIAKNKQAVIFQPFEQADKSTHSEYGGTGLGLSNVKNYCDIIGGEVSVESQLDIGTTFIMRLPTICHQPHEGVITLFLDVNPKPRKLSAQIMQSLSENGFYLLTTNNATFAQQLARRYQPHIIVLNLDDLKHLQHHLTFAETPLVLITRSDAPVHHPSVHSCLTKPVDRIALLAAMSSAYAAR